MKKALLFFLLLSSSFSWAVIDGLEVKEDQFLSVVELKVFVKYSPDSDVFAQVSRCTGTYVRANVILTAAHCLSFTTDKMISQAEIRIGDDEVSNVVDIKQHPGYRNGTYFENDLALIIVNDKRKAPVVEQIDFTQVAPGDFITVVGYGVNDLGFLNKRPSGVGIKRSGANQVSHVGPKKFKTDKGKMVDAGKDISFDGPGRPHRPLAKNKTKKSDGLNVSIGSGDSGGPVFRDGQIVGVNSNILTFSPSNYSNSGSGRNLKRKIKATFGALFQGIFQKQKSVESNIVDLSLPANASWLTVHLSQYPDLNRNFSTLVGANGSVAIVKEEASAYLNIMIKNEKSEVIETIPYSKQKGQNVILWSGIGPDGKLYEPGAYLIYISNGKSSQLVPTRLSYSQALAAGKLER